MKNILLILLIAITQPVLAERNQFQIEFDECISTLKPLERVYEKIGKPLDIECKERAERQVIWKKTGEPTYIIMPNTCEFLGKKGSTPESCLPEILPPEIKEVMLLVHKNVNAGYYANIADVLKSKGAEGFMLKVME